MYEIDRQSDESYDESCSQDISDQYLNGFWFQNYPFVIPEDCQPIDVNDIRLQSWSERTNRPPVPPIDDSIPTFAAIPYGSEEWLKQRIQSIYGSEINGKPRTSSTTRR